ncbi:MAG: hypothetical protein ACK5L7_02000 [Paludibacteraceae bacterium]
MKTFVKLPFWSLFLLMIACSGNTPVPKYVYENNPDYTWGTAQFYGNYYSNYDIQHNVLTLNLLTENFGVDAENQLIGTGQYLIIEDIFVHGADTLLPAGTYIVADTITDIAPFTFLKGKEYKENSLNTGIPSGAYVYYFENDVTKNTIKYISEGNFTVAVQNDSVYTIQCNFKTNDGSELKGTFEGVLYHSDESVRVKSGLPRKKSIRIQAFGFK